MTNQNGDPRQDDTLGLQRKYDDFVQDLAASVDAEADLAEILQRARYDEFVDDISSTLNVENDLKAALVTAAFEDRGTQAPLGPSPETEIKPIVNHSEDPPTESECTTEPQDRESGAMLAGLASLRDSFLADKEVRRAYTKASLHAAAGHLRNLDAGLRLRRLSKSQAHETLARAELALTANRARSRFSGHAAAVLAVALAAAVLPIATQYRLLDVILFVGPPLYLISHTAFHYVGQVLLKSEPQGDQTRLAVTGKLRHLHGDVDRLFEHSNDYGSAVSSPQPDGQSDLLLLGLPFARKTLRWTIAAATVAGLVGVLTPALSSGHPAEPAGPAAPSAASRAPTSGVAPAPPVDDQVQRPIRHEISCLDQTSSVPMWFLKRALAHVATRVENAVTGPMQPAVFQLRVASGSADSYAPEAELRTVELMAIPPAPRPPLLSENPFQSRENTRALAAYEQERAQWEEGLEASRAAARAAASRIRELDPPVENTGTDVLGCVLRASDLLGTDGERSLFIASDLIATGRKQAAGPAPRTLSGVQVTVAYYCADPTSTCMERVSAFTDVLRRSGAQNITIVDPQNL